MTFTPVASAIQKSSDLESYQFNQSTVDNDSLLVELDYLDLACSSKITEQSAKDFRASLPENNCPICLTSLNEIQEGNPRKKIGCSNQHIFHEKCIDTWLARNRTCPLDRENVSTQISESNTNDVIQPIGVNITADLSPVLRQLQEQLDARAQQAHSVFIQTLTQLENNPTPENMIALQAVMNDYSQAEEMARTYVSGIVSQQAQAMDMTIRNI